MANNSLPRLYKNRSKNMRPVISMTGSGLDVTAPLPVLCAELGAEEFDRASEVNIASTNALSFFLFQAHTLGQLKAGAIERNEELFREVHKPHRKLFVNRILGAVSKKASFYGPDELEAYIDSLFAPAFLLRKLNSFNANLRFFAYCLKKQRLTEISTRKEFGDMTVSQVIRATCSAPALHNSFVYKNRLFVDILQSAEAGTFLNRLSRIKCNHLIINNVKEEDAQNGLLFHRYSSTTYSKAECWRNVLRLFFKDTNTAFTESQERASRAVKKLKPLSGRPSASVKPTVNEPA